MLIIAGTPMLWWSHYATSTQYKIYLSKWLVALSSICLRTFQRWSKHHGIHHEPRFSAALATETFRRVWKNNSRMPPHISSALYSCMIWLFESLGTPSVLSSVSSIHSNCFAAIEPSEIPRQKVTLSTIWVLLTLLSSVSWWLQGQIWWTCLKLSVSVDRDFTLSFTVINQIPKSFLNFTLDGRRSEVALPHLGLWRVAKPEPFYDSFHFLMIIRPMVIHEVNNTT